MAIRKSKLVFVNISDHHPRTMNKAIQDEFTDLPVSRQRKSQMRQKRDGRCTACGKPRVNATHCLYHAVYQMNYSAKRNGTKKRASTCLTLRLLKGEKYVKRVTPPAVSQLGVEEFLEWACRKEAKEGKVTSFLFERVERYLDTVGYLDFKQKFEIHLQAKGYKRELVWVKK